MTDQLRLTVRRVLPTEARRLRDFRLAALACDPAAFGVAYEQSAERPLSWWAELVAAQDRCMLVAEDEGGRWLGMAMVRSDTEERAGLYSMWVVPSARGSGIAGRLCDACAGWVLGHGHALLRLTVVKDNEIAKRAYEKAGFALVDGVRFYHDMGLVTVFMQRSISGD